MSSPNPNSVFAIAPGLPRSTQRIEVAADVAWELGAREVSLYVDGEPLGELADPPYRVMWRLEPGDHTIRAVARDGDGKEWESSSIEIRVVEG